MSYSAHKLIIMSFVEEFRKNIPYIVDGAPEFIMDRLFEMQVPLIPKGPKEYEEMVISVHHVIQESLREALTDWLNEYQTELCKRYEEPEDFPDFHENTQV